MVRLPGFEPGSSTWQYINKPVDWAAFEAYLAAKKYRGSGARTILSYATRYSGLLLRGELGKLTEVPAARLHNILKGLAALSKFLGCYSEFQKQRKAFGLTWVGKSADELIIDRITKIKNPNEIFNWIREVKKIKPELTEFVDLMAITGLRMIEGVYCFNLIWELSESGKLDQYYNVANGSLEHFRFKELFLRNCKKAFVSFVPEDLVKAIAGSYKLSSSSAISRSLRKNGLKARFSDVRENHGSFMTKYLKESEINFLHGRVTSGVFMQHYFNPALIGDLRTRAYQGIREIQERIKI